jgi:hypothetical protein
MLIIAAFLQDELDDIVSRLCGVIDIKWDLDYSSMEPWLKELILVPSKLFKRIAHVLPSLHARITDLVNQDDFSSSGDSEAPPDTRKMVVAPSSAKASSIGPITSVGPTWVKVDFPVRR